MSIKSLYILLIAAAVCAAEISLPSFGQGQDVLANAKATPIAPLPYDGVISYRRPLQSRHLATLVKTLLKENAVSTYMDIDDGQNGTDHNQLLSNIRSTSSLIVILEPHSLDACLGDTNYADPMHQEIKLANDIGLRMVPVFDGYDFPNLANYSQAVQNLLDFQGVSWTHILARPSALKIIQYMNLTSKGTTTFRNADVEIDTKLN